MKQKLALFIIMAVGCSLQLKAQAPQGINYQAALRNGSGNPIATANVIFRFSIIRGSANGTVVYQETQTATTNAQGIANTVIGKGAAVSGSFAGITWGTDPYFIKTEANPGTGFTDMGTQQLMSVPYSLYSASAGNLDGSASIDPSQISGKGASEGQVLKWNGSNWVPVAETITGAGTGIDIDANGVINTPWTSNGKTIYNNNTGNVGIGTNAPEAAFHLAGKGKEIARVEYTNAAWMNFYNKDSCLGYLGVLNDTSALDFGSSGAGKGLNLVTDSKPRLTIDNNGFVGIGNNTPGCMLDIWNRNGDSYVVSRASSPGSTSLFKAMNDNVVSLDLYKNSVTATGSVIGMPAANMAGITNALGSMLIATTDSMALGTAGSARVTIQKTGEIMVNSTSSFSNNSGLLTVGYPAFNANKPAFEINGSNVWMGFKNGNTIKGYIQQNADNMTIGSMSGDMTLYSNNAGRIYIKKSGIGIRTNIPKADLHIEGTGAYRPAGLFINSASAGSFTGGDTGTLTAYNNYTGTNYSYAFTATSKGIYGYGTFLNSKYCGIRADVAGGTNTSYAGYFTSSGTNVSNYGAAGIANGTGTGNNYGVYGNASGGTLNYSMYCAGNGVYTGTWASSSDQRLKKEIKPLGSSLDLVMQLKPSSYLYRTEDPLYKNMNLATGIHYGFIAQELERVIPAVVSNNSHKTPMSEEAAIEFKAVNYTELIPVLTKAIQEQQAQIKALEERIKQLENKGTN